MYLLEHIWTARAARERVFWRLVEYTFIIDFIIDYFYDGIPKSELSGRFP